MSTTKNHRRAKLQEKSSSFHGKPSQALTMETRQLCRPSTQPNLLATSGSNSKASSSDNIMNRLQQPTKLLLNVTILGCFGPVHIVMPIDSTVANLIGSAVRQYVKEGRRPVLPTTDPSRFDIHYSQFCLECLDREERLENVSSRNLLLCPKNKVECVGLSALSSSCAEQAQTDGGKATGSNWFKFMNFLI